MLLMTESAWVKPSSKVVSYWPTDSVKPVIYVTRVFTELWSVVIVPRVDWIVTIFYRQLLEFCVISSLIRF